VRVALIQKPRMRIKEKKRWTPHLGSCMRPLRGRSAWCTESDSCLSEVLGQQFRLLEGPATLVAARLPCLHSRPLACTIPPILTLSYLRYGVYVDSNVSSCEISSRCVRSAVMRGTPYSSKHACLSPLGAP